jgi:MFS family permease
MYMIKSLGRKISIYFPALRSPNFKRYWVSQCISLTGTWIQIIGQSWLVYSVTKSALLLGIIGALQFIPLLLFSVFAGSLIDKASKKNIIMVTQALNIFLSIIPAILIWTGYINISHIIALAISQGFINTIDMPARQAFISELVDKENLVNAIVLNSSVFNAARIIGPALAGLLMGYFGVAVCFLINAFGFVIAQLLVFRIRIPVVKNERIKDRKLSILSDTSMGLVYLSNNKGLYRILLSVAVMGIFALNFNVLIPILSSSTFHQTEAGFGFLMTSMGIGSLIGALLLALIGKFISGNIILVLMPPILSLLLIFTGLVKDYRAVIILIALSGLSNTLFFTSANSSIQLMTVDEYRGRINSLYTLVYGGSAPIGNFFAGGITEKYGIEKGFILSGILNLVFILPIILIRAKKVKERAKS